MNSQEPRCRRVFAFEADFAGDLRCLPMAVRRKLDLAGVKLKLLQWHGLEEGERRRLLAWDDDDSAIAGLREWLLARSATLPEGPARALEPAVDPEWRSSTASGQAALLGLTPQPERWRTLDELERFALLKLSHPGHEHRNLPRALAEFGALADPLPEHR